MIGKASTKKRRLWITNIRILGLAHRTQDCAKVGLDLRVQKKLESIHKKSSNKLALGMKTAKH